MYSLSVTFTLCRTILVQILVIPLEYMKLTYIIYSHYIMPVTVHMPLVTIS